MVEIPVEVEKKKDSESEEEELEVETITLNLIPQMKQVIKNLRDHVIDVLMRETPGKKSYYKLVWDKQTFEELVKYKIPNVFDEVPEDGFEAESDKPEEITVSEYLEHLFKNIGEKLEDFIPDE